METKFTPGPWSAFPHSDGNIGAYELSIIREFGITRAELCVVMMKPSYFR